MEEDIGETGKETGGLFDEDRWNETGIGIGSANASETSGIMGDEMGEMGRTDEMDVGVSESDEEGGTGMEVED